MDQSGSAIIRSKWKTGEARSANMSRLAPASPPSFPSAGCAVMCGSKLRRDPVYPAAYELFRGSDEPILDIGCGLGLLAFYLRERGCRQPILGLDVDARKIRQGSAHRGGRYRDVDLRSSGCSGTAPGFLRQHCSVRCASLSAARPSRQRCFRISPDASRREACSLFAIARVTTARVFG